MRTTAQLNVLQINKFNWPKGGSEKAYLDTMDLLEKHGHHVVPFSMKDERNLPSPYSNYFVENVGYDSGGFKDKVSAAFKVIYSFDARKKMQALLRDFKPDIAHFHNFQHQISPSVFGPLKENKIPIVMTVHDLKPMCANYKMLTNGALCEKCKGGRFYNCLLNRCMKGSALQSLVGAAGMYFHRLMGYYEDVDVFITPSEFVRGKMLEFGFPEGKLIRLPNFIDSSLSTFSITDLSYVLYFGRLSEEKGVKTLLRAAGKCREIRFLIAGDGPLKGDFHRMAQELNLENVKFLGHQEGSGLRKLIMDSSFTVIPSECYENCPMSVLESFAVGKPVVGSRIGGIPELINEGIDGLTFKPGNPDDLAEKLRILWNAKDRIRKHMGLSGHKKVDASYVPERYYELLMEVYQRAINSRAGYETYHKKIRRIDGWQPPVVRTDKVDKQEEPAYTLLSQGGRQGRAR